METPGTEAAVSDHGLGFPSETKSRHVAKRDRWLWNTADLVGLGSFTDCWGTIAAQVFSPSCWARFALMERIAVCPLTCHTMVGF